MLGAGETAQGPANFSGDTKDDAEATQLAGVLVSVSFFSNSYAMSLHLDILVLCSWQ